MCYVCICYILNSIKRLFSIFVNYDLFQQSNHSHHWWTSDILTYSFVSLWSNLLMWTQTSTAFIIELHSFVNGYHRLATDTTVRQKSMKAAFIFQPRWRKRDQTYSPTWNNLKGKKGQYIWEMVLKTLRHWRIVRGRKQGEIHDYPTPSSLLVWGEFQGDETGHGWLEEWGTDRTWGTPWRDGAGSLE